MAHAIRVMPESDEARAIRQAERVHGEALESAVTQLIGTMPRMFRSIKHGLRQSGGENPHRDLGEQQIWVLYLLGRGRQLTSELAKTVNVAMPTITRVVEALVEKGYVERKPDARDRRCIYLELTEKGTSVSDSAHAQFRSAVSQFLSPLTDEQLRVIGTACRYIATLLPDGMYDYESACPARPEVEGSGEGR